MYKYRNVHKTRASRFTKQLALGALLVHVVLYAVFTIPLVQCVEEVYLFLFFEHHKQ